MRRRAKREEIKVPKEFKNSWAFTPIGFGLALFQYNLNTIMGCVAFNQALAQNAVRKQRQ